MKRCTTLSKQKNCLIKTYMPPLFNYTRTFSTTSTLKSHFKYQKSLIVHVEMNSVRKETATIQYKSINHIGWNRLKPLTNSWSLELKRIHINLTNRWYRAIYKFVNDLILKFPSLKYYWFMMHGLTNSNIDNSILDLHGSRSPFLLLTSQKFYQF